MGLVFVGDKTRRRNVAEVKPSCRPAVRVADLSGQTTLRELAAVLAACDLVVSGDTGPMHLAVAVGTPVVALFGATDPRRHGPYGSRNVVLSDAASVTAAPPGQAPDDAGASPPWRAIAARRPSWRRWRHEIALGHCGRKLALTMRKILVVNMNYMGDALLTTPALAALRRAYPDAQIDTVVGAGAAAQVLEGNPDLDHIIARTARGSWARCVQIYNLLREGHYSDAIILPPLPAYAAAAFVARTRRRIGQAGRGMNRFLTHLRPTQAVHMADAMLDTMPISADARPSRRRLSVTVARDEMEAAERLLLDAGV